MEVTYSQLQMLISMECILIFFGEAFIELIMVSIENPNAGRSLKALIKFEAGISV